MTTIPQLPSVATVTSADLLPLSQGGTLYAASVAQVTSGLQDEIVVPTGEMLGRASAGAGAPESVALGAGLALSATTLAADGLDHLTFPLLSTFVSSDEVIVNAGGAPARLPAADLRGLFTAGSGISIDSQGTLSVTASGVAGPAGPVGPTGAVGPQGPAGPVGPQGQGLAAPGTGNTASGIVGTDYVAIWQNGANAWISYKQLIGGETIDQLPAAGPAGDGDLLLVAQGGNALASQSFAAIWAYVAAKLPTVKPRVVELTGDTVLDATTHNRAILVASQPLAMTANFANMGSGFTCRLLNLSSGSVTMGTGIRSGTGATTLPPGSEAELLGVTYSGGSLVWWSGFAPSVPTLTVDTPAPPGPNVAFTVSGALYNDTPTALDYSTDGSTWTAAPSPTISASGYSFQMPGLAGGTYTLHVRDHNNPSVFGVSASFSIAAPSVAITSVPASVAGGGTVSASGTVAPAGAAVQIGLSASATSPPASFTVATVSGGTWSGSLTVGSNGPVYVWAQQTASPVVEAVSTAISVTASTPSITYTVNKPSTTSYAAGSGTVPLNGSISPAQTTATQVALSVSNAAPPSAGWQAASIINNNTLWAIYATVPATAGAYYVWVETAAGQAATVSGFTLTVT